MHQRVRDKPSRDREEAIVTHEPESFPHGRGSDRGFSHLDMPTQAWSMPPSFIVESKKTAVRTEC
jgi:hypothetical protein